MDTPLPDALAFTPVPTARRRRDGWTPERQHAFILALAQLGLAGAAAREVGMSRKSAYALLKRAGPESGFARAWEEAVVRGRIKAGRIGIERAHIDDVRVHGLQQASLLNASDACAGATGAEHGRSGHGGDSQALGAEGEGLEGGTHVESFDLGAVAIQ